MGHKASPILSFCRVGISDNFYSTKYMTQSTYPSFSGTDELLYVSYRLVRGKIWYSGVPLTAPNFYQIDIKCVAVRKKVSPLQFSEQPLLFNIALPC